MLCHCRSNKVRNGPVARCVNKFLSGGRGTVGLFWRLSRPTSWGFVGIEKTLLPWEPFSWCPLAVKLWFGRLPCPCGWCPMGRLFWLENARLICPCYLLRSNVVIGPLVDCIQHSGWSFAYFMDLAKGVAISVLIALCWGKCRSSFVHQFTSWCRLKVSVPIKPFVLGRWMLWRQPADRRRAMNMAVVMLEGGGWGCFNTCISRAHWVMFAEANGHITSESSTQQVFYRSQVFLMYLPGIPENFSKIIDFILRMLKNF